MDPIKISIANPIQNAVVPSLVYDDYIRQGEVYHVEGIALDEFVDRVKMVLDTNVPFQVDAHKMQLFPGEIDPAILIFVASEEGKKVVRTMLKAIWVNASRGVCYEEFGWNNILVTRSGKSLFLGVEVIRNLQGDELEQMIERNYDWALAIIERLYGNGYIPGDIQHLLDLLRRQDRPRLRPLYHVHASLIPIPNYCTLYKEIYDHVLNVLKQPQLFSILDDMSVELPYYVDNWRVLVATNDLLMIPFEHSNSQSYLYPLNQPNQTKTNTGQRVMLDLMAISKVNKKTVTAQELNRMLPLQLLVYLRHRPAHRMDAYKIFVANHPGQVYNAAGSDRVCQGRFAVILPYLQLKLFDMGEFGAISTHYMF